MILTHLQIDIDTPSSVAIKKYIIEYGDDYSISPATSAALILDNLPLTYFAPNVRAMAKGYHPDSDQYVAYLRQQEDTIDKGSNSSTQLNRPKLAKPTIEAIQVFDTLYTAYILDGGKADFLSLILTEARFGLLGIVAPDLGCKSWNAHDPRLLIAAIRQKISSAATAIVQPASKVFQTIMMVPSSAYTPTLRLS